MCGVFCDSALVRGGEFVLGLPFGEPSEDDLRGDSLIGGDTADSVVVVNDVPAKRGRYCSVFDCGFQFFGDVFWCHDSSFRLA